MEIIEVGIKNDTTVYADKYFTSISKDDLGFVTPDYEIKCDSGAYPGVTDFEQYLCNKARLHHF